MYFLYSVSKVKLTCHSYKVYFTTSKKGVSIVTKRLEVTKWLNICNGHICMVS